jgi:hypothetical protein
MTKEKQITIKMNTETASAVLEVLLTSQVGYSYEFAPERITCIRKVIGDIKSQVS